jgi:hypothetical protein
MEFKIQKSLKEMEAEAKLKHRVKLLYQKGGQMYATFRSPGDVIRDQGGRVYRVHDDGSLRRIKEKSL